MTCQKRWRDLFLVGHFLEGDIQTQMIRFKTPGYIRNIHAIRLVSWDVADGHFVDTVDVAAAVLAASALATTTAAVLASKEVSLAAAVANYEAELVLQQAAKALQELGGVSESVQTARDLALVAADTALAAALTTQSAAATAVMTAATMHVSVSRLVVEAAGSELAAHQTSFLRCREIEGEVLTNDENNWGEIRGNPLFVLSDPGRNGDFTRNEFAIRPPRNIPLMTFELKKNYGDYQSSDVAAQYKSHIGYVQLHLQILVEET